MRVRDHTHRRTHTVVAVASLESGRKSHSPISYLLRSANTHAHKQKPLYTVSHVYMRTPSMCMCECILNQSAQTCVNWRLVRVRCVVCAPQQHDDHRHHHMRTRAVVARRTHTQSLWRMALSTLSLFVVHGGDWNCTAPDRMNGANFMLIACSRSIRLEFSAMYVHSTTLRGWPMYTRGVGGTRTPSRASAGETHQQRTLPVHRSRA